MVSLAELPVGAEAYSGQPEDLSEVISPLVSGSESVSTYDFGVASS